MINLSNFLLPMADTDTLDNVSAWKEQNVSVPAVSVQIGLTYPIPLAGVSMLGSEWLLVSRQELTEWFSAKIDKLSVMGYGYKLSCFV